MRTFVQRTLRHYTPLSLALPLTAVLVACASETQSSTQGNNDGGGGAGSENRPPVWSNAPAAPIDIDQGLTLSLAVDLADPDGDAPTLAIDPATLAAGIHAEPSADSTSLVVHAEYAVAGATSFDVTIDDGKGSVVTTKVTLNVRPIVWLDGQSWDDGDGPTAREHAAMIVDATKGRAFMIHGSGYMPEVPQGTPLDSIWGYDLATGEWSSVTATGDALVPAGSRRVAQIPGKAVAYLFGGYGAGNVNDNNLYRASFDGDDLVIKLLDQTNPPPARALHMFAYEATTDRFFAFGGVSNKVLGDTWTMTLDGDVATWTKLDLAVKPTPRYGFFYGVDDMNGRAILFSGAQGTSKLNPAQDTWALDMRSEPPSWALIAEGANTPIGRRNGCSVFDPVGPRFLVFGGTADAKKTEPGLFMLDARPGEEKWTELTLAGGPKLRSSGFGIQDPSSGRMMLGFGNDAALYRDWWTLGY